MKGPGETFSPAKQKNKADESRAIGCKSDILKRMPRKKVSLLVAVIGIYFINNFCKQFFFVVKNINELFDYLFGFCAGKATLKELCTE